MSTLTANLTAAAAQDSAVSAAETVLSTAIQNRQAFYRDVVDVNLPAEAAYVETTSMGDAAKIVMSGFDVLWPGGGLGPVGQVENLHASVGDDAGEVDLGWNRLKNAASYEVWRNTDPNNAAGWAFVCSCTKSKVTVEGLTSGVKYWFRVRATGGSDGTGPWSDPATCYAT